MSNVRKDEERILKDEERAVLDYERLDERIRSALKELLTLIDTHFDDKDLLRKKVRGLRELYDDLVGVEGFHLAENVVRELQIVEADLHTKTAENLREDLKNALRLGVTVEDSVEKRISFYKNLISLSEEMELRFRR